jgi:hypothetical protein
VCEARDAKNLAEGEVRRLDTKPDMAAPSGAAKDPPGIRTDPNVPNNTSKPSHLLVDRYSK